MTDNRACSFYERREAIKAAINAGEWPAVSESEILAWIAYMERLESELDAKGRRLVRLIDRLAQAQAAAVQWVTYDGTRDTLPPEFTTVALLADEALMPAIVCHEEMDDGQLKPFWSVPFEEGDFLEANVGDRWAYLPALPEAAE